MSLSIHISFYYKPERIQYLRQIVNETSKYTTQYNDVYIHTNNKEFVWNSDCPKCTHVNIVYHDMKNEYGHYLTWKCRSLIKQQHDKYDYVMYVEDDVLVPKEAIEYWFKYKDICINNNYNLGFVRVEVDNKGTEYCTDIFENRKVEILSVEDSQFAKLDCYNESYSGMWIYDKQELQNWISSKYWDLNNIMVNKKDKDGHEIMIREKSAYGLHYRKLKWYKCNLVKTFEGKLLDDCRVYHLANNYIGDETMAVIPFKKIFCDV